MDFKRKLTFITLIIQFISMIESTPRPYCEWGICESWEQCCGENVCCTHNDITYNVMITVCVFLALLVLCCSIFFICRYFCRIGRPMMQQAFNNYVNLPRDRSSSTTNLAVPCAPEYDERIYSDPPPPYSEVVQIRK